MIYSGIRFGKWKCLPAALNIICFEKADGKPRYFGSLATSICTIRAFPWNMKCANNTIQGSQTGKVWLPKSGALPWNMNMRWLSVIFVAAFILVLVSSIFLPFCFSYSMSLPQ